MKKIVLKTEDGIKIKFLGAVQKQNIISMVQNCSSGACECMSDETKSKVKEMRVDGNDGDVELNLKGNLSIEEIQEALSKSKVINP